MPIFFVRFKGMLNKSQRERLDRADITIQSQERSLRIDNVMTGVPIYTVHAEAASESEALEKVRTALDPDTGNFSNWETDPA